jgi:hypothetical protein
MRHGYERGTNDCKKCKYYRESTRVPALRCCHIANLRQNYIGTVYMKTPNSKNWNYKCEHYEDGGTNG